MLISNLSTIKNSCTVSNSDAQIQQQIGILNQDAARARTGLSFQLVSIDRTINPSWTGGAVGDGTQEEYKMKTALRKGNVATLNVYSVV